LLEVVSFEMTAGSVGTVTKAQSWEQRIVPNFRRCDREAIQAPNVVRTNRTVSSLILETLGNEQKCECTGGNVNM